MKWILSCKVGSYLSRLLAKLKGRFGGQLHYINGAQTLPPPLSRQEEEDFFQTPCRSGRGARRQQLIVHNLRLVVYIARKFESTGIGSGGPHLHRHHWLNQGGEHLLAGEEHQAGHLRFPLHRKRNPDVPAQKPEPAGREVSIDEPLNIDWDGNELLLSDILGTDADAVSSDIERDAERAMLHRAINSLEERERSIMRLRFGLYQNGREHTQKEVADRIGISQSYISRLEKRIIRRLRVDLREGF